LENIRQILASNIKARRAVLKISQERLAELANISSQMINGIEGCRTWVSDKTLEKIAGALEIKVYQLMLPENCRLIDKDEYISIELENLRKFVKDDIDACFDNFFYKEKAGTISNP
jgi:transcriptional regulator with XRE-family HTH domain